MDEVKSKTKIYLLVLSLVVSLVTVAFVRFGQSATPSKPQSASQTMKALEGSTTSPEMRKFIDRAQKSESADEDAYRDLGK